MRLPQVSYADGIKTAKQDEFAGLSHNLGAMFENRNHPEE